MIKYACAGCAYPYPEDDDPNNPRAQATKQNDLRRWHLREIANIFVGFPIKIHHKLDGVIVDPSTGAKHTMTIHTAASGARNLGIITQAWIKPETGGLFWAGELTFDKREVDLISQFSRGQLGECSLHHNLFPGPHNHGIQVIELSICARGLRPGSIVYAKPDLFNYMRNNGFKQQIRIMASADTATVAIPTADAPAPAPAAPASAPVQQQRGVKRAAGDPVTKEEILDIFKDAPENQWELFTHVFDMKVAADKVAAQFEADAKLARQELVESNLAQAELYTATWKQLNADLPESQNPIAIMAANGMLANMTPEQSSKAHRKLTLDTIAMQAAFATRNKAPPADARRSADIARFFTGMQSVGYNVPAPAAPAAIQHTFGTPPQSIPIAASAGGDSTARPQQEPRDLSLFRQTTHLGSIANFLVGRYDPSITSRR